MSKSATKERPQPKAGAPNRAGASAEELFAFLEETGTPRGPLAIIREWLDGQTEPTAEALYRYLELQEAKQGTLRKAGKWVWGDRFEPASAVEQAPEEEILRLRTENARLKETLEATRADKLGLTHQNRHLQEQLEKAISNVAFLKIGRDAEELRAAGIN